MCSVILVFIAFAPRDWFRDQPRIPHASQIYSLPSQGEAVFWIEPELVSSVPEPTRLDKASVGFRGMKADVIQTVHTAIVNDDSVESGNVRMRRAKPGDVRILLEFTTPNRKMVSVDNDECRIYLPKANTVQVYDLR